MAVPAIALMLLWDVIMLHCVVMRMMLMLICLYLA